MDKIQLFFGVVAALLVALILTSMNYHGIQIKVKPSNIKVASIIRTRVATNNLSELDTIEQRKFKILYWTGSSRGRNSPRNWFGLGEEPFQDCEYQNWPGVAPFKDAPP